MLEGFLNIWLVRMWIGETKLPIRVRHFPILVRRRLLVFGELLRWLGLLFLGRELVFFFGYCMLFSWLGNAGVGLMISNNFF